MRFELDLKGSFAYTEEDIQAVFNFMEKSLISPKVMLNKKFILIEAAIALKELFGTTEPIRYAFVP